RLAVLVAAADTGERHHRADIGAPALQPRGFRGRIERLALQANGGVRARHGGSLASPPARDYPPVIGGKNAISCAPAILVCAGTCARSIAARITFGFSKACAYSSPREASHVI